MKRQVFFIALAFCSIAAVAGAQTIVNSWSTGGTFPGGLDYDSGTGTIWVADQTLDLIQQFDRNGNLLNSFPSVLPMPIGVGVDPATGNVWIGDETEVYYEMTSSGVPTGNSFSTLPYITDVSGVALDPVTGHIYISQDSGTRQIGEFDQAGNWIQTIDLSGSGSTDPDGLAYNSATQTFLLGDDTGDLIIEVDMSGTALNTWDMGVLGISPEGVGLDNAAGTVFISDGFGTTVFEVAGIIISGGFTLTVTPDPLQAGQNALFSATAGTPNAATYLVYSLVGPGSVWVPPLNITIDLANPKKAFGPDQTNGSGDVSWNAVISSTAGGISVWFQAVQYDNKTNVVATSVQ